MLDTERTSGDAEETPLHLLVILFSTLLVAQKRNSQNLGSGIPDTERIAREVRHQLLLLPILQPLRLAAIQG